MSALAQFVGIIVERYSAPSACPFSSLAIVEIEKFHGFERLKLAGECFRQCYSDNGQKAARVHLHRIGKGSNSRPFFAICGG